jgi:hypothetical protein
MQFSRFNAGLLSSSLIDDNQIAEFVTYLFVLQELLFTCSQLIINTLTIVVSGFTTLILSCLSLYRTNL